MKTCCEFVKRAAKQLKERIERSLRDTLMNLRKTMNQRTTMDFGGNTVLRKLLPNLEATKGRDIYIAKNQKLCQNQNSKWRNFAMAFILNLVRLQSYHTVFNPYLELDFQMDVGKCDFFHFSFEMWLSLHSLI